LSAPAERSPLCRSSIEQLLNTTCGLVCIRSSLSLFGPPSMLTMSTHKAGAPPAQVVGANPDMHHHSRCDPQPLPTYMPFAYNGFHRQRSWAIRACYYEFACPPAFGPPEEAPHRRGRTVPPPTAPSTQSPFSFDRLRPCFRKKSPRALAVDDTHSRPRVGRITRRHYEGTGMGWLSSRD